MGGGLTIILHLKILKKEAESLIDRQGICEKKYLLRAFSSRLSDALCENNEFLEDFIKLIKMVSLNNDLKELSKKVYGEELISKVLKIN